MITYIEGIPRIKEIFHSSANANAHGSSRERIASSGWGTEILQRSSISPCVRIQHTHTHAYTGERKRVSLLAPRSHFSQPRDSIRFLREMLEEKNTENRKTPGGSGKLKLDRKRGGMGICWKDPARQGQRNEKPSRNREF